MTNPIQSPPHNLDAERNILGAVLVDHDKREVLESLKEDVFYHRPHKAVFKVMLKSKDLDLVSVCDQARRMKLLGDCGGAAYISSLVDGMPKSSISLPVSSTHAFRFGSQCQPQDTNSSRYW